MILQLSFSDPAFADCLKIRMDVFVDEQNVPPEEERDEFDKTALHFLALRDGVPAGTARVILKGSGTAKITRVAVQKSARGAGIGAALMRHIEAHVPAETFVLDAQTHAAAFYESLGFAREGEDFMEAGIPHIHMRKSRVPE